MCNYKYYLRFVAYQKNPAELTLPDFLLTIFSVCVIINATYKQTKSNCSAGRGSASNFRKEVKAYAKERFTLYHSFHNNSNIIVSLL